MWRAWSLRWLAVLALLAGGACSGSSESGPAEDASPDSSAPPPAVIDLPGGVTTSVGLVTTVASRFPFVDYQTSGGGVSRGLLVWPDGRAACSRGDQRIDFSVPAATVAELRSALEAADMPALPAVNGTPATDVAVSRVIFGGQSVRSFGDSMPPALAPAVGILDRLLARGCP